MNEHMLTDILVFLGLVIAMALGTTVLVAFFRRRQFSPKSLDEISARLSRIEQSVDTTALEMERVSEAQRFTARILAERAKSGSGEGDAQGSISLQ